MKSMANIAKLLEFDDSDFKNSQDNFSNSLDFDLEQKDKMNRQNDFSYKYDIFQLKINKNFFMNPTHKKNPKIVTHVETFQHANIEDPRVSNSLSKIQKTHQSKTQGSQTEAKILPKSVSDIQDQLPSRNLITESNKKNFIKTSNSRSVDRLNPRSEHCRILERGYSLDDTHFLLNQSIKATKFSQTYSNRQTQKENSKKSIDSDQDSNEIKHRSTNRNDILKQNCNVHFCKTNSHGWMEVKAARRTAQSIVQFCFLKCAMQRMRLDA